MFRKILLASILALSLTSTAIADELVVDSEQPAPELVGTSSESDLAVSDESVPEPEIDSSLDGVVDEPGTEDQPAASNAPVPGENTAPKFKMPEKIPGAGDCHPTDLPELSVAGVCKGVGVGLNAGIGLFSGFVSATSVEVAGHSVYKYDPKFPPTLDRIGGFYSLMSGGVCKGGISDAERAQACADLAEIESGIADLSTICDPAYDGCQMIIERFAGTEDPATHCSKSERAAYGTARMKVVLQCE